MDGENFPRGKLVLEKDDKKARDSDAPKRASSDRLFKSAADDDNKTDKKQAEKGKPRAKSASGDKSKKSKGPGTFEPATADHGIRKADELNAKRLRPGLHVLARVRRVAAKQIVLSLPSGLTGYCRLNDINDAIATVVRSTGGDDDDADDAAAAASASGPQLSDFFVPGQYVCATIMRVGDGAAAATSNPALNLAASMTGKGDAGKKKIFVSLRPDTFNNGLTLSHVKVGSLVYGFVRSVEDHGYVVATGIEGATSFLPFTGCDGTAGQAGTKCSREQPGTALLCSVSSVNRSARTMTLACKADGVSAAVSKEINHTLYTLKPGMLVDGSVDRILPNGLAVTFLGFFKATVALPHLPKPASALWASQYKVGDTISGRILFVDALEKAISLSAAPHVASLGSTGPIDAAAASGSGCGIGGPVFDITDGGIVEEATVVRIDHGTGMLVAWGAASAALSSSASGKDEKLEQKLSAAMAWGHTAYVHISRIADTKVDSIEKLYKIGATTRVRCIGFAGMEGCAQGSTKPSVLNASVVRVSDVLPGSVVEGTVSQILVDQAGDPKADERAAGLAAGKGTICLVKLGEGVTGSITAMHVADILPARSFTSAKNRSKFFESVGIVVGEKIRCRVLTVDPDTGRIQLTIKKSLMNSTLPAIASFADAASKVAESKASGSGPLISTGFVTALKEGGVIVTFFGNCHGIIPSSDLVATGAVPADKAVKVEDDGKGPAGVERLLIPPSVLSTIFTIGQVIKVRVVHVQASKGRMRLSASLTASAADAAADAADSAAAAASSGSDEVAPAASDLPAAGSILSATVVRHDAGDKLIVKVLDDASASAVTYAELPLSQLTDHPTLLASLTSADAITGAGAKLHNLLVLAHTRHVGKSSKASPNQPLLTLTAKSLLVHAAQTNKEMTPSSINDVRAGLVVAGYVASVTAFAAFVRFLDGCTGVAPRSKWPKEAAESEEKEYKVGQSVLAVVDRVTNEEGKSRFSLSLLPDALAKMVPSAMFTDVSNVIPSALASSASAPASAAAIYLRSYLLEQEAALAAAPTATSAADDDDDEEMDGDDEEDNADDDEVTTAVPSRFLYPIGARTFARVQAVAGQTVLLELPPPSASSLPGASTSSDASFPAVQGFSIGADVAAGLATGAIVPVRILDVDAEKEAVMVQILPLPKADKADGKKRKRESTGSSADAQVPTELPSALPGGLASTSEVPAAVETAGIKIGDLCTATVVQHRKGSAYAVVRIHAASDSASAVDQLVAFAAVRDYVRADAAIGQLKAGEVIEVVVTQTPSSSAAAGGKSAKKGKKSADTITSPASAAAAAVDSLLLCTAAPALIQARKGVVGGNSSKARSDRKERKQRSASAGNAQEAAVPAIAVDTIVPGMVLTAVTLKAASSARKSTGASPAKKQAAADDAEDSDSDASGNEDDEVGAEEGAGGSGSESDSSDGAGAASDKEAARKRFAERAAALALGSIKLKLKGVKGTYIARLSLAECVDVNPYTGQPGAAEAGSAGLDRYRSLLSAGKGTKVQVKVTAVTVRQVTSKPQHNKRVRRGSDADASSPATQMYTIEVTVRPSDLALPEMHLASPRATWPTDSKVVSPATVIAASAAVVSKAGPASFLPSSASSDAASKVVVGSTGFGIIEGLSPSASHLVVGLGGGVRTWVPILEAGDRDDIRDPVTGALHVTDAASKALSLANILSTHPVGSIVPVVITSMGDGSAARKAQVSIRKARQAMAVAANAIGSNVAAASNSSKKGKKAADAAPAASTESATSAVAKWLAGAARAQAAAAGAVTLARVQYSDRENQVDLALPSDGSSLDTAQVPSNAARVRVQLVGGSIGYVDITHVADRASWTSGHCGKLRDGQVVPAVILQAAAIPSAASASSRKSPKGDSSSAAVVSFRKSWIEAATAAAAAAPADAAAPASASKKGSKAAGAPAAAPSPFAAAAARLDALEKEEATAVAAVGTKVSGYVVGTSAKGCFVRLCRTVTSRVQLSQLSDRYVKDPVTSYPTGKIVTGVVTSSDPSTRRVDMTLKQSQVNGDKAKDASAAADSAECVGFRGLRAGAVFDGSITKVAEFGVFVQLSRTDRYLDENVAAGKNTKKAGYKVTPISGLCHHTEIDDDDAPAAGKAGRKGGKGAAAVRGKLSDRFSVGDRVRIVVLEVDAAAKKLSLSMKPSRLSQAEDGQEAEYDDAEEMDEDDAGAAAEEQEDDDEVDEDEMDEDDGEDDEGDEAVSDDDDEEESDDEYSEEEEEEADPWARANKGRVSNASAAGSKTGGIFSALNDDDDDDDEMDSSDDDAPAAGAKSSKGKQQSAAGAVGGFAWDASLQQGDDGDAAIGSDSESESEESDDDGGDADGAGVSKAAARKAKRKAKVAEEEETRRLELRLASGEAAENPETVDDFERLVLEHPNSAVTWIRYMAWQLSVTEVEKAREIAERALKTIAFREEAEKLSVWTAMMNLEAQYGDAASLAKVFQRALAAADAKSIHHALLGVYQRVGDARAAECDALFQVATKKFGKDDVSLWTQWAAFKLRRGDAAGARALIPKASAVLPKAQVVDLTIQFALLEYRFASAAAAAGSDAASSAAGSGKQVDYGTGKGAGMGSQERGRTLLENLLAVTPKRLDVWNVYTDQEIAAFIRRYGAGKPTAAAAKSAGRKDDLSYIRNLFDRIITLHLSSKKMKFMLKKYLKFESEHGDAAGVQRVQDAAKAYIARVTAGGDAEEEK